MRIYHILTHSVDMEQHPEFQNHPERLAEYNGHPNRLVKQLIRYDKKKEFEHTMVNLSRTMTSERHETTHQDGYPVMVFKTSISIRDPAEVSLPLVNFVRSIKEEVLHVQGISSFIYDSIAPFLIGKPSIAHVRGGYFTWRAFPVSFPKYVLLAPFTLRMPRKLFVQNRTRIERYQKNYFLPKEKMVHVPNGIDLEQFKPDGRKIAEWREKLKLEGPAILFSGRLEHGKGVLELVEAFGQLGNRNVKLVIAGTGRLEDTLRSVKNPNIVWLGRVPFSEMPSLHYACDIFALPSYSEGFPNTVLEAMACGKAVVTTPTDGALDLVEDGKTGLLVEIGSSKQLVERLEVLIKDEALRKQLGKAAQEKVKREFTWERVAENAMEEYRKMR